MLATSPPSAVHWRIDSNTDFTVHYGFAERRLLTAEERKVTRLSLSNLDAFFSKWLVSSALSSAADAPVDPQSLSVEDMESAQQLKPEKAPQDDEIAQNASLGRGKNIIMEEEREHERATDMRGRDMQIRERNKETAALAAALHTEEDIDSSEPITDSIDDQLIETVSDADVLLMEKEVGKERILTPLTVETSDDASLAPSVTPSEPSSTATTAPASAEPSPIHSPTHAQALSLQEPEIISHAAEVGQTSAESSKPRFQVTAAPRGKRVNALLAVHEEKIRAEQMALQRQEEIMAKLRAAKKKAEGQKVTNPT